MDDTEYKNFVYGCLRSPLSVGTDTNTEEDDPPYIFNDHIFDPGWQFDLDEALRDRDNFGDDPNELHLPQYTDLDNQEKHTYSEKPESDAAHLSAPNFVIVQDDCKIFQEGPYNQTLASSTKAPTSPSNFSDIRSPSKRRRLDVFDDPEFARILNQQLRQHIQLLTQIYLLTENSDNRDLKLYADDCKKYLHKYDKDFKTRRKPSNLLPSLELIYSLPKRKVSYPCIRSSWRQLPVPAKVAETISKHPSIFIYKKLLPQVAFSFREKLTPIDIPGMQKPANKIDPEKKSRVVFTLSEDTLLAFGLNDFKGESSQYALIASLLITAKSKTQIIDHIKNINRSPVSKDNPIKIYLSRGELPRVCLDDEAELVDVTNEEPASDEERPAEKPSENSSAQPLDVAPEPVELPNEPVETNESDKTQVFDEIIEPLFTQKFKENQIDIMDMDLDDLMAASTTISKAANSVCPGNNKNIRKLELRRSMLNLIAHKFSLSQDKCDFIISDFLRTSQDKLSERNYMHLLQLLTNLMKKEIRVGNNIVSRSRNESVIKIYNEICEFLRKIQAPSDIGEKLVLFLDYDQAKKCGCALEYLHWMRFFEFMQHLEMYHDSDGVEKRLARLIDALQKDDAHKVKLAAANLVNKHPLLQRDFDGLALDGKPHASFFMFEEDFDDITEPISMIDHENSDNNNNNNNNNNQTEHCQTELHKLESFHSKPSKEEMNYATQSCPCKCHRHAKQHQPIGQHCSKCNLRFIKGKIYLVNKIKPILAKWSYTDTVIQAPKQKDSTDSVQASVTPEWTFEEDKEILEFCQEKADSNEDTISFDSSVFEEFLERRKRHQGQSSTSIVCKRSARQIAERFNQLMEIYGMNE